MADATSLVPPSPGLSATLLSNKFWNPTVPKDQKWLFDVWTSYFGIMSRHDTIFDLKINVGWCDLYFMVQWFCLISWRLFDIWTPYFGIMSQYDPMFDLKLFIGHCHLYFMVQWFGLVSWKLFSGWTYESECPGIWPQDICRSQWLIFHSPLNLPYFGIMSQYYMTFDLEINVGHCDQYFKVQWFCLIY